MTESDRRVGGPDLSGEVQRAMDRAVREAVLPVLTALASVYGILTVAYLLFLPRQIAIPLAIVAGTSAVVFWGTRGTLARWPVPPGSGHLAGTIIAAIVLFNILIHLQITGEPRQTTNLLLVVLGTGLLFVDRAWFAVVATLAFMGWLSIARTELPDPEWVHYGVTLFFGTALGAIVLVIRARNLAGVEELRMSERVRQLELVAALDQTERARQGEQDARQELESALVQVKESEERFRGLADATFEGVVIFRSGHVVDANTRAAELFGVSVPQLLGDPVLNLFSSDSREAAKRVADDGEAGEADPKGVELEARRYDGTRFPVAVSAVETVHQGRQAKVLVIRDITDQKRVEEVLRRALDEAEANSRSKSSFLANMSHELRTPLNSVIGFANILLKKLGGTLAARETDYLTRILSNGEHLLSLIDDILDLSKIDAERMELVREPLHLDETIADVVRTLDVQARKRGLELLSDVPTGLRPLIADARRMRQVLLNLAGNAVKFTPSGSVTLRVIAEPDTMRPARLEVSDTGIGIPSSKLEEIFSPFLQVDSSSARSFGGTGLGLTISRSLCQLMGFELTALSREGEGSTFVIEFESQRAGRSAAASASPESAASVELPG